MITDAENDEEKDEMLIVHADFWRQKFKYFFLKINMILLCQFLARKFKYLGIFKDLNFRAKNDKNMTQIELYTFQTESSEFDP